MWLHAQPHNEELSVADEANGDLVLITRSQVWLLVEGNAFLVGSDPYHAKNLAVLIRIERDTAKEDIEIRN